MLKINEKNRVTGRDIHSVIESKNNNYSLWVARMIEYADLQLGKDFFTVLLKSTGGRPSTEYEFTLDAAKEICLLERNEKGKQIRRWLIGLSTQRENLELITVKEAAFAVKVINCMKYINNQKEAYTIHKDHYVEKHTGTVDPNYIYSDFAKYRAAITGWSKDKVDAAIDVFLADHVGHNRKTVMKEAMPVKLSIMDINEAIRVAVLDILFSNETDVNLANRFSKLCKNMAAEMKVEAERTNTVNLFREKEKVDDIRLLQSTIVP